MLELVLALLIAGIALLHILVDSFQPLLVLRHACLEILFGLLTFFKDGVVVYLFDAFPLCIHLLLDVKDQGILEPNTVSSFGLD